MFDLYLENQDSKEYRYNIARRIHDARKKKFPNIEDFAEKIGYSKPTVLSWERGWNGPDDVKGKNSVPSVDQLVDIAPTLDCSISYLLCECDGETPFIDSCNKELGINSEACKALHNMKIALDNAQKFTGGPIQSALNFINYMSEHSSELVEPLSALEAKYSKHKMYLADPYYRTIRKAYEDLYLYSPPKITNSLLAQQIIPNSLIQKCEAENTTIYERYGLSDDFTISDLASGLLFYLDVITEHQMSISRLELLDVLSSITNSFLELSYLGTHNESTAQKAPSPEAKPPSKYKPHPGILKVSLKKSEAEQAAGTNEKKE